MKHSTFAKSFGCEKHDRTRPLRWAFAFAALASAGGVGLFAYDQLGTSRTLRATVTENDGDTAQDLVTTDAGILRRPGVLRAAYGVPSEFAPGCTYDFNVHGSFLRAYPRITASVFVPTEDCPASPVAGGG